MTDFLIGMLIGAYLIAALGYYIGADEVGEASVIGALLWPFGFFFAIGYRAAQIGCEPDPAPSSPPDHARSSIDRSTMHDDYLGG